MNAWSDHGETVKTIEEIVPALKRAIASVDDGQLALLDVNIDLDPLTYPEPVIPEDVSGCYFG